jgi:hypothetical protein
MVVAVAPPRLVYRPQSCEAKTGCMVPVTAEISFSLPPNVVSMAPGGFASSAGASSIGAHSQVISAVRMPSPAMRLACVLSVKALAAPAVFLARYWLKMLGVGTIAGAAQVVKLQAICDWANIPGIREAVDKDVSPSFASPLANNSVSSDLSAVPSPAGVRVFWCDEMSGEPLLDRTYFSHAYIVPVRAVD